MPAMVTNRFETPDETRTPDKTRVEMVDLGGGSRQPGSPSNPAGAGPSASSRWSGTETCQARHVGAVVSGRRHLTHADGTELDIGAGDAYAIEPGHDTWVPSEEPFVTYEFESATAETFAQPAR